MRTDSTGGPDGLPSAVRGGQSVGVEAEFVDDARQAGLLAACVPVE
ncbi:hypothetical protein ABII15_14185 [Streptomyces sp. HUAS MG91]|uniref:Uncharacterized protein n=1 Tax=Streptomyces tabacisoli TaxID=3156398 RepID=A0AAU8ISF1_9ACTN